MMIGSAIFVFFGLSLTQALILQDYRLGATTTTCAAPPLKNCTAPGLLCESCTSLVLCLGSSSTNFEKSHVQTCSSNEKCVGTKCTADARDPVCDGITCLDFVCTDQGVFPDPFDCRKYVFCVLDGATRKLKAYPSVCDQGFGFNPARGICDVKLEAPGKECSVYPVPLCGRAGETKALPANPSIYYVCKRYSAAVPALYPMEMICPHGMIFNNQKYQCE